MSRALLITLVVVLALLGALAFVGAPEQWPPVESAPQQGEAAIIAADAPHPTHAPAALARLIREPQNTWSNLAFVFGGAWLLSTTLGRLGRGVGVALIAVGVGSFLYHASVSRALRHLDVGAMYWVFLMIGVLACSAVFPRSRAKLEANALWLLGVGLMIAGGFAAVRNVDLGGMKPFSLRPALAATTVVTIASLALLARRRETVSAALQLLGIVTLLGAALAFQTADRPGGRLFKPHANIQAHALWHLLAAATMVWVVRFIDRETALEKVAAAQRVSAESRA